MSDKECAYCGDTGRLAWGNLAKTSITRIGPCPNCGRVPTRPAKPTHTEEEQDMLADVEADVDG